MKKVILFILVVIMLTGLFTGCDLFQTFFGETLIGSWVYEIEGGNDSYLTKQVWEFKLDGTALDSLTFLDDPTSENIAGTDILTFDYVDNGDTISFTYVSQDSNTGRYYSEDDFEKEYTLDGDQLTFINSDNSSRTYTKE